MTHNPETSTLRVLVRSMTWEADDVVSLRLEPEEPQLLPQWEPGAHIDLLLEPGLERQYSLCGDPADRSSWRIAVRKEEESRGGSLRVHSTVRPGQVLSVRGPRNHFRLEDARSYLFIAGGIGITPVLPMVRQVAAAQKDWRLVYGGRHTASMAFVGELECHGERVTLHPQDRYGLLDLPEVLGEPRDGLAVYACGPEPMLAALEQLVAEWPPGVLHTERFKPRQAVSELENSSFDVVLARSRLRTTVRADQSILDALEEAGIFPLFSCREGTCGTCETVFLEGEPDHRDSILSDVDRRVGKTLMVCVSRSRSPEMVLDI